MIKKDDFTEKYKYGFKDEYRDVITTGIGLNEDVVREISALKKEPDWMLQFRLKALKAFLEMAMPNFGPDLSFIDFQSYTYFTRPSERVASSWLKKSVSQRPSKSF